MTATTYYLQHLNTHHKFLLKEQSVLVGRSENCDVQIHHETLSREHSRFTKQKDSLFLEDLHSTNGTFLNGRQISKPTHVQLGDVVRFGQEPYCLQSTHRVTTQRYNRDTVYDLRAAMLSPDEEDTQGTSELQEYPLPLEWRRFEHSKNKDWSAKDLKLISHLKRLALKKLELANGLMVVIANENQAPSVKILATGESKTTWTLGRSSSSSLRLNDPRVSEQHCEVRFEKGKWTIRDKDSLNGMYHLRRKVTELKVESTTDLDIGPFTLTIEPISKR